MKIVSLGHHILSLTLLTALVLTAPLADSAPRGQNSGKAAPHHYFTKRTADALNKAIGLLNKKEYAKANATLAALNLKRLSPYELSRVEEILSSISYSQGNYKEAQAHLVLAIGSGGLNPEELSRANYQIAQLLIAQNKWKQSAAQLEKWFKTAKNPDPSAYYLLAVVYYHLKEFDKSLPAAIKAVNVSTSPRESWVQLVVALYLRRQDYRDAVPWVEKLVAIAPNDKDYWIQLSSLYQQLGDYHKALAITQLAYAKSLLSSQSDLERLSDLLMFNKMPYDGGVVLEKAIADKHVKADEKTYKKLANAWVAAGEYDRAVKPLEQAAKLGSNGKAYNRLGQLQLQREDWPAAAAAFRSALVKGHVDDPANVHLMLGIALYRQGKYPEALKSFNIAAKSHRYRKTAKGYLRLLKEKMDRKS